MTPKCLVEMLSRIFLKQTSREASMATTLVEVRDEMVGGNKRENAFGDIHHELDLHADIVTGIRSSQCHAPHPTEGSIVRFHA